MGVTVLRAQSSKNETKVRFPPIADSEPQSNATGMAALDEPIRLSRVIEDEARFGGAVKKVAKAEPKPDHGPET